MILSFAHPGVVVPDLEAASGFYSAMFGFRVISEESWKESPEIDRAIGSVGSSARGLMMAGHNCFIELWEYSAPDARAEEPWSFGAHEQGIRHLAFYVDDAQNEFERLLALGGQALGEPVNGVVYCRDPFGNIIELCEIPNDEENPLRLPGIKALSCYPEQEI